MTSRYGTLSGKKLLDPAEALQWAAHNSTPRDFWLTANSYSCGLGREPGRAYVLLTRRDAAALDANGLHTLTWVDGNATTTFSGLILLRADSMSLSDSDPDACYLVQLLDKRASLRGAINAQYNVRVPAGPRQTAAEYYYPESLNGGATWTWQQMLDDIWSNLPAAVAGASPALPYSPDGIPEQFRFIGVDALDSYCAVLAKLGCDLKYDPVAGTFGLVQVGAAQAGLAVAEAALARRRVYDYDTIDANRADKPATIRVFFHKRAEDGHGSEKDTPRESNWEMDQVHSEDVATGIDGAEGVMPQWDDLPALVDKDGALTNSSALATRAAEVAAKIAAALDIPPDRVHYGGCITTILPGSEVAKVVWRDYADGYGNASGGLITEVHKSPREKPAAGNGCANENLQGPDLARRSHPVYPDLAQHLVVYHDSASYGEFVEANADGLHPGYIVRVNADQTTEYLERVWILFTDNFELWAGQVLAVQEWQYGPGRLSGTTTSEGETYPLYRVTHGERHWEAVNIEEVAQGASGEIEILWFDTDALAWGDTGIRWDAWDWFMNDGETLEPGYKLQVKWEGPILVITAAYCSISDNPYIEALIAGG